MFLFLIHYIFNSLIHFSYLTSLFSASTTRVLATECLLSGQNCERYNRTSNNIPEPTRSGARPTTASALL